MRLGKVALRMINSAEKAKFPNVETALFPLIYVEMTFGIFSVIFFFGNLGFDLMLMLTPPS